MRQWPVGRLGPRARLLVVGFERARRTPVQHQPHVGLVDPHAEGTGGHDDRRPVVQEGAEHRFADVGIEPGVIGRSLETPESQRPRDELREPSRGGIDDHLCGSLAHQRDDPREPVAIVLHPAHLEPEIRPVERGRHHLRVRDAQHLEDLPPCRRRGAAGERQRLGLAQVIAQLAELLVDRPEAVAPLDDAVSLVHREQRDARTGVPDETGERREPFGSAVQQSGPPAQGEIEYGALVRRRQRAVQEGGGNAPAAQRRDLVLHQRDERRYDDGQPVREQRRYLVAQRLPRTGGQHGQHVPSGEQRREHAQLSAAKALDSRSRSVSTVRAWYRSWERRLAIPAKKTTPIEERGVLFTRAGTDYSGSDELPAHQHQNRGLGDDEVALALRT